MTVDRLTSSKTDAHNYSPHFNRTPLGPHHPTLPMRQKRAPPENRHHPPMLHRLLHQVLLLIFLRKFPKFELSFKPCSATYHTSSLCSPKRCSTIWTAFSMSSPLSLPFRMPTGCTVRKWVARHSEASSSWSASWSTLRW